MKPQQKIIMIWQFCLILHYFSTPEGGATRPLETVVSFFIHVGLLTQAQAANNSFQIYFSCLFLTKALTYTWSEILYTTSHFSKTMNVEHIFHSKLFFLFCFFDHIALCALIIKTNINLTKHSLVLTVVTSESKRGCLQPNRQMTYQGGMRCWMIGQNDKFKCLQSNTCIKKVDQTEWMHYVA